MYFNKDYSVILSIICKMQKKELILAMKNKFVLAVLDSFVLTFLSTDTKRTRIECKECT